MKQTDYLRTDLAQLLNRFSRENESDTPDFVLAEFLVNCLDAFDLATNRRTGWYESDTAAPTKQEALHGE